MPFAQRLKSHTGTHATAQLLCIQIDPLDSDLLDYGKFLGDESIYGSTISLRRSYFAMLARAVEAIGHRSTAKAYPE